MKINKLFKATMATFIFLLLSACSTNTVKNTDEGGIGGTGNSKECAQTEYDCEQLTK